MSYALSPQQIAGIGKIEIIDATGPTTEETLTEISTDSTITPEVIGSMKSHGNRRYAKRIKWTGEISSEDFSSFSGLDTNMKNNTRRQVKVYDMTDTLVLTLDDVLVEVMQELGADPEAEEVPFSVGFETVQVHQ